jgi:SAM-dependent methyltransferase
MTQKEFLKNPVYVEKISPRKKTIPRIEIPSIESLSPQKRWALRMVQMPRTIGGGKRGSIKKILSKNCYGNILEAMCGFNSYIAPSKKRNVTALDYCEEALERYLYPERKRILFDLNVINNKNKIEFFDDDSFDAISICFGAQYIKHPLWLLREFNRILSPGGSIYFVENPNHHYYDLVVRKLNPLLWGLWMEKVFGNVTIEELPIATRWEMLFEGSHYYLFKSDKS